MAQAVPVTPATRSAAQRGVPLTWAEEEAGPQADAPEPATLLCPNCGARSPFDGVSYATECPYCGTPLMTHAVESTHLKPKALLPFAVTEAEAFRAALDWLRTENAYALPDEDATIRLRSRLKGVFLPFWLFGAQSDTDYTVNITKSWYEVDRDFMGREQENIRTKWHRLDGALSFALNDVLVAASTNPPKPFDVALEPWDFTALVEFRRDYLAGFHAEAHQISPITAHKEARHKMHGLVRDEIQKTTEGREILFVRCDTTFSHETYKLVLLPYWIADYSDQGSQYLVFINGQTGKTQARVRDSVSPRIGWSNGPVAGLLLLVVLLAVTAHWWVPMVFRWVGGPQ